MKIAIKQPAKPFPSSKIKDVVFHGSHIDFDKFSGKSEAMNGAKYGEGFYFTKNINRAKGYGKYIYQCYINVQRPFILNDEMLEDQVSKKAKITNTSNIKWYMQDFNFGGRQKILKQLGYDAIVFELKSAPQMNVYVVFEADQIKIIDKTKV